MDPETAITIKTFPDQTSADLAAAELKRAGIDYMLVADDAGGMLPSLQLIRGIKLLVDPSEEDDATAVLDDLSTVQAPGSEEDRHESTAPRPSGFWTGLAIGIVLGIAGVLAYREISSLRTRADEYDRNDDGRPDEVWHYQKGRAVRGTMDRNFDGRVDVWNYFNDAALYERTEEDNNFDGKADSWGFYKFGQMAAWQYDSDFNGQHDVTSTFRDGIVQQSDWRPNGSKTVTIREIYKHGAFVEELRDLNKDGQFDMQIKFDSFHHPIETNYLGTR